MEEAFKEVGGAVEGGELACVEGAEARGQGANPAATGLVEYPGAFGGCSQMYHPSIFGIYPSHHQPVLFQGGDDASHGGGFNLFGGRQFPQRQWTGKDHN